MMHKKSPQESKLAKCKVTRLNSTHTLITIEANTNMSFFDHGNIVGTISNGKSNNFWIIILNKADYISFLTRRDPTANNCFTRLAYFQEVKFVNRIE